MNEARIRESFARQAFMGTIGASLGRIAPFDKALAESKKFCVFIALARPLP